MRNRVSGNKHGVYQRRRALLGLLLLSGCGVGSKDEKKEEPPATIPPGECDVSILAASGGAPLATGHIVAAASGLVVGYRQSSSIGSISPSGVALRGKEILTAEDNTSGFFEFEVADNVSIDFFTALCINGQVLLRSAVDSYSQETSPTRTRWAWNTDVGLSDGNTYSFIVT